MDKNLFSKNIFKLQLLYGINGFTMFFGVIYVLFLQTYLDSFTQISLLLSISIGLYIVFEYITGIFADKYGRVKSIQLGHFFAILAMIIFLLSSNFYGFLFALICLVLGGSFNSGSIEALFYESLKKLRREKEYDKILSNAQVLIVSSGIITNFLAPFLFNLNPKYPFIVSLFFAIVGFIMSLFLIDTILKKKNSKDEISTFEIFKQSSKLMFSQKFLFLIFLYSVIFSGVIASFGDLFNQPLIFDRFGIELYGIIFALATVVQTIIIYYAPKMIDKLKSYLFLILLIVWMICLTVILFVDTLFLIIFFMGLLWCVGSIRYIFISKTINEYIKKDKIRASTHSFLNLVQAGFIAIVILIGGILIDVYSLEFSLIILNLVLIGLTFIVSIFLLLNKNLKN